MVNRGENTVHPLHDVILERVLGAVCALQGRGIVPRRAGVAER